MRLIFAALLLVVVVSVVTIQRHSHVATRVADPSLVAAHVLVRVAEPAKSGGVSSPLPRARRPHQACNAHNWRTRLTPIERWIDRHESGLNPASREPTTGAYGLGQLLPQTWALVGVPMSPDPCVQIRAARLYVHRHYGSWRNALDHWRRFRWY